MDPVPPGPAGGAELEADLCITGAGPAGLTLARELVGTDLSVVLLESGGDRPDPGAQLLNDGRVRGDRYAGLRTTRRRQVGGSANSWNTALGGALGAKFAPLDPVDLEGRPGLAGVAWPFDRAHLDPYYRLAQLRCGLGPFQYDGAHWVDPARPALEQIGPDLVTRVYQLGGSRVFTETYGRELRAASNVTLYTGATAVRVGKTDGSGMAVVEGANRGGGRFRVRSRVVVLAGGAVENARLLLASGDSPANAPGNQSGWLGRGFMEHPRDRSLVLLPRRPRLAERLAFYDRHAAPDGTLVAGRLALSDEILERETCPNAYLTILPGAGRRGAVGWLPAPLRSLLLGAGWDRAEAGYGWSAMGSAGERIDRFHLLINLEQRPHPDNRVVLSPAVDRFGVPRAELHWRWRAEERAALARLHDIVRVRLEAAGLFRVTVRRRRIDPNAHHHAGTTRMHADPRHGVADPNGRVHGTDHLYLAGASLFPTAGAANPTLTVVALTLRLADHLKARLSAPAPAGPTRAEPAPRPPDQR
jgi:choline dehydrogenase-like flavoprotein